MDTKQLRQKILDLAIRGKLVPQDPNDEPASALLARIKAEKEELIKDKKIKPDKKSTKDKSHYQNEVPFEVPENWEWVKLGYLCDYGKNEKASPSEINENAWILDLEDIEKDTGKLLKRVHKNEKETKSIRNTFKKGDVLYSKLRTYLNKVLVADFEGYCTTEILPLDFNGFVVPEFARHVLMSNYFLEYTAKCCYGVKMPRLGTNDGRNAPFSLPPLAEQHHIVSEIERYFALIDEIEANKSDLQTAITQTKSKVLDLAVRGKLVPQDPNDESASVVLERISKEQKAQKTTADKFHYPFEVPENWEWCKLGEVNNIARGGSPRPIKHFLTKNPDGVNWIKIGDTEKGGKYIYSTKEKIIKEGIKYSRFVNVDDFLLTNSMSFGRPYILKTDGCIHDGWLVISIEKKILNTDYMYYLLSSHFMFSQFYNSAVGSTVKNLKTESVCLLFFPLPPLAEQKRIVFKVEEIFAQLDMIEEALKA